MVSIESKSRPSRHWRAALLAIVVLTLTACGTQLIYNRLDTLLYLYVSSQVSLQKPQSQQLKASLGQFLDWHRRIELPRYARFAEQFARDAAQPLGHARIDRARLEIESLWQESVQRGGPDAARWLASLSRAQLDELFASQGDDDAEYREEFCDGPEARRLERRQRSFIDSAEDWVGRLNPAQRALVRDRIARLAPTGCGWVEQRIAVRTELRRLVESDPASGDSASRITRLLSAPEEQWDADYRRKFAGNRDRVVDLLTELDASLEPRQRRRLETRLQGFAADFRELSGTAVAERAAALR